MSSFDQTLRRVERHFVQSKKVIYMTIVDLADGANHTILRIIITNLGTGGNHEEQPANFLRYARGLMFLTERK